MTNQLETRARNRFGLMHKSFDLFEQRLMVAKQIGAAKQEHGLSVLDSSREDVKDQVTSVSNEFEPYELLEVLMETAKAVQETSREL